MPIPRSACSARAPPSKIKAALAGLPLDYREGTTTTGFVAILRGGRDNGRTVLLRGDMDALPMQEETGLPFASRVPGAMHACGHDAHSAMLVGAARALCARRESLSGSVVFMFQPGEEGYHGARFMIEDGLLDDPRPEAAFALHISPNMPAGMIVSRPGPLLASADTLSATIRGRGGHGAMPHDCIDPVPIACEIVTALQTYIARQVAVSDPAVLTIAKINAGTAHNIIPTTADLLGTLRTLSERDAPQGPRGVRAHRRAYRRRARRDGRGEDRSRLSGHDERSARDRGDAPLRDRPGRRAGLAPDGRADDGRGGFLLCAAEDSRARWPLSAWRPRAPTRGPTRRSTTRG